MARDTLPASSTRARRQWVEDLGRSLNYKPVSVLGEGSHGVVLLVEHKRLDKRFVMKLIQQKFLANRDVVGRFIAEAQRGAKLNHEAFAPIIDLGETEDGRTYFVMEYVEGVTLQQALRDRGFFETEEAINLTIQLLDGLAAAHAAHLIHRDIKPANLFLTKRNRLKILDLGISKSILDTGTGPHTAQGLAIGTPKYMSPEQALGKQVSYATDLYAVGLVMFEMLAGVPAFDGAGTQEILRKQVYSPAPSLRERSGRQFPALIEQVVARALLKEPEQRFQTATEMIEALNFVTSSLRRISVPPADQTANENARPTVKIDGGPVPPDAYATDVMSTPSPSSHSSATRPVSANALVIGAASTSPQAIIVPPSHSDLGTARTEALPVMTGVGPHETGGATTRTHDEQSALGAPNELPAGVPRSRPLFLVAAVFGALAILIGAVSLIILIVRPPRETTAPATSAPIVSVLPIVPTPPPSVTTTSSETPPAPSVTSAPSAPSSTKSVASAAKAKPAQTSHYQAAVDAMNAGDLETADAEARLAVESGGGTPAQLLHAQVLERRGKKAAARDVYRKILEKDPTMAAAVAGLKRCGG